MAEIKPQMIGTHERAFLSDMRAQHAPQSFVQQMCGAVMRAHMTAPHMVNILINRRAFFKRTSLNLPRQNVQVAQFLARISDSYLKPGIVRHNTGIAHLTAAFGIKRRLVYYEVNLLACRGRLNQVAVGANGLHHAFGLRRRVADKFGRPMRVA